MVFSLLSILSSFLRFLHFFLYIGDQLEGHIDIRAFGRDFSCLSFESRSLLLLISGLPDIVCVNVKFQVSSCVGNDDEEFSVWVLQGHTQVILPLKLPEDQKYSFFSTNKSPDCSNTFRKVICTISLCSGGFFFFCISSKNLTKDVFSFSYYFIRIRLIPGMIIRVLSVLQKKHLDLRESEL